MSWIASFNFLVNGQKLFFGNTFNCFSTTAVRPKVSSSNDWYRRHNKDQYVKKSQEDNYRARSAYKLLEIQEKHGVLRRGDNVLECGGAPGAWTQVCASIVGGTGKLVSCDLLPFEPVDNAIVLPNTDFTNKQNQTKMLSYFGGDRIDAVLSDMSPNLSGNKSLDQDAALLLVYSVIGFAVQNTKSNGCLLFKMFSSSHIDRLLNDLKKFYRRVDIVKPQSSRKESAEIYVLATQFTPPIKIKT
eukprot:TRINITY_DN10412_c0_g1_i1.p1 TRINITY_DN10412_c0_g1~~TRINITY_DN10412_c0_g1_i1.p1  ORF type:complete len:244 (-),score=33.43 TRINITY_DN10412_c0_g1_i1:217-948(-)